jgi:predicted RecA/RadA family phage recombinase
MTKKYEGEGNVISHTLSGTVSSGDMIAIGGLLGVCLSDGVSGDVIAVQVCGVFNLPAVTGAAFTIGQTVTYDSSAGLIDDAAATPASGDLTLGCVVMETLTASAGDSVAVKLNVAVNTVT